MDSATMTRGRRLPRIALVLAMLVGWTLVLTAAPPRADAAVLSPFNLVYARNTTGNVLIAGNSSMTCPTPATNCVAARGVVGGGIATTPALNNNYFTMGYVNSDTTTAGVFDSSSSTVSLPSGATVLFAALVWSGTTSAGVNGVPAPTPTDNYKVRLRVPGSTAYTTVGSSRNSSSGLTFQGYADVTAQVTAAGSGDYTVANVQSGTGQDRYAGWSLAVAYQDATAPLRNLSVFSGFAYVSSSAGNTVVDVGISGFTTPPSGAVRTTVGAVAWEGDAGSTGDQLLLGPDASRLTNLSDSLHAATNVFNSVISRAGTDPKTRSPAYNDNFGVDEATISANGVLPNGSTDAVVRFTSTSEAYYPGLMTFATDLYAPRIDLTKSASYAKAAGNAQSQSLEPGDTVTYTITGTNNGSDAAAPTLLTDAVPAGTTYVPGSLTIGGSPVTDAPGDDLGGYAAAGRQVTASLGTGATPTSGGSVAIGAAIAPVVFSVTVDPVSSSGSITNTARIDYRGVTSGQSVSGASNTLLAVAYEHRSDLGVTLTGDPGPVQRGAGTDVAYHATVTNAGPYDEPAAVLHDVLPAGATVVSASPGSGTCTTASGSLTCSLGRLASGAGVTVDVVLHLDAAPRSALSTAGVSGDNADVVGANDTATATTLVNGAPTAVADAATTTAGTVRLDPAANDTDGDPDTLRVASVGTPSRGTAVLGGDGTVTYTASAGQAGTDSFEYVVSDGRGGTSTGTITVTVPDTPPVAAADGAATTPRTPVDVDVLANDTDANIPTVAGQSLSVASFTQPAGGTGTVARSGSHLVFTPSAGFVSGSTTFDYTVSDGAGGSDTATVTVTMADVAPVAVDDTASTAYRTPVDVDVLADDRDDNGDPLTLTGVTGALHGTATVVAGRVRYVPDAGWSGVDHLTYTITDGTHPVSAHLDVTTENAAPVAADFALGVPGGGSSAVDVLAHATDPNGDDLTVVGAGPATHGTVTVVAGSVTYDPDPAYQGTDSFDYVVSDGHGGTGRATVTVTVAGQPPTAVADAAPVPVDGSVDVDVLANDTDPNGDALTVTDVGRPAHGTAFVNAAGGLTYRPDPDFLGEDAFGYTVSDGHGGLASATVTMTVADQPPDAQPDDVTYAQAVGSALSVDVLANDTDPNDDPLHLVAAGPTSLHGGTVTVVAGRVAFVPDPSYAGDDSFDYTVGDSRGGVATATVTVHVVNRDPVAHDDTVSVARTTPTTVDVLADDTDPDGEALAISSVDAHSAHGGTVVVSGGQVVYTPAAGYLGPDSFGYAVTDPRGGTDTATVHVEVANAVPTAGGFAVTLPAGTTSTLDVLDHARDADGDPLTVTVDPPAHGTAVVDADGAVAYTPAPGRHGVDTLDYTVSDGHGGQATGTVTITVGDRAPVAHHDTVTHRQAVGTALEVDVLADDTDPDGDALAVTSVGSPAHGTVSLRAGVVRYSPDADYVGDDSFTYVVSDGYGGTDQATVTVHVENRDPIAVDDAVSADPRTATTVAVLTNDADPDGEALSVTSVDARSAQGGTVVLDGGRVVYTPAAGYVGLDRFDYVVTDPRGGSGTATVTVSVGDQAPSPAPDQAVLTGPVGGAVTLDVLGNDSDPDGDALHLVRVGRPGHGTAVLADGKVVYTPDVRFAGVDTFTYTVADEFGRETTETVTVTVVDRDPQAVDDHVGARPGWATVVRVLGNDTDADGEGLTVRSADARSAHGGTVTLVDGRLTYTPAAGFQGEDTFSYTVADPRGGTDRAVVHVLVGPAAVPEAPTPTPAAPATQGVSVPGAGPAAPVTPAAPTASGTPSTPAATTGPAATPGAHGQTLPDTGGPAGGLLWAGLGCLLAGAVLVGGSRLRSRRAS